MRTSNQFLLRTATPTKTLIIFLGAVLMRISNRFSFSLEVLQLRKVINKSHKLVLVENCRKVAVLNVNLFKVLGENKF